MEIYGKIIQKLPLASGTSKAGNAWRKQEYVLETVDNFPKKVLFHFFGDRVDQYPAEEGDMVTVSFDLESREFNGRWYTDVRGWKLDKGDTRNQQAVQPQAPANNAAPAGPAPTAPPVAPVAVIAHASDFIDQVPGDDLPF